VRFPYSSNAHRNSGCPLYISEEPKCHVNKGAYVNINMNFKDKIKNNTERTD